MYRVPIAVAYSFFELLFSEETPTAIQNEFMRSVISKEGRTLFNGMQQVCETMDKDSVEQIRRFFVNAKTFVGTKVKVPNLLIRVNVMWKMYRKLDFCSCNSLQGIMWERSRYRPLWLIWRELLKRFV